LYKKQKAQKYCANLFTTQKNCAIKSSNKLYSKQGIKIPAFEKLFFQKRICIKLPTVFIIQYLPCFVNVYFLQIILLKMCYFDSFSRKEGGMRHPQEILQAQLVLLSEVSETYDDCLLAELTLALCKVIELLKEISPTQ